MTYLIVYLPRTIAVKAEEILEEFEIPPIPASKVVRGVFKETLIPSSIARLRDIQALIGQALEGQIEGGHTHPIATELEPGWMSSEDRQLLARLEAGGLINSIADVPGLEEALLKKANELDFSASIRYIDELGGRVVDAERLVEAQVASIESKAPIVHRHSINDIDGYQAPVVPGATYAYFRVAHEAAGEIRQIGPDAGTNSHQERGIALDGATMQITEAGIYTATVGGRLSSYMMGAQFNLYVEHNGSRIITSVNTYCATIPLRCAVGDTVRFLSFSTASTTLTGAASLHKIA